MEFRIQSINTKFYIIFTDDDADGTRIVTQDGKDSIPKTAVVMITPPFKEVPVPQIVNIIGIQGLHVALKEDVEGTYLTWSKKPYEWTINSAPDGTYITPTATDEDLYWFDEFGVGIGNHVIVKAGRNIKPPQSEWKIMKA